jgi:hypothetical protein
MDHQPTFLSPHRPLPVRCYNSVADRLTRRGFDSRRLYPNAVLRMARLIAGRHAVGDDAFLEPLERLLQSMREDARMHAFGRSMMFYYLSDLVANRIKIQADLERYPAILDEPIRRPLFVLGLPRTGTTLLYNLLSQDPASRPLMAWESKWPSPPPQADKREGDPRIWRSRASLGFLNWMAPTLNAIHPMTAEGPEECIFLTMNTMVSSGFLMLARLGGYEQWLRELPFERWQRAYRDYRRQLQLLQWRSPGGHWVLKSPVHISSLDALFDAFPDACVVQTHRNPARVVPSLCSMFSVLRGMLSDEVNAPELGLELLEGCHYLVERSARMRETLPDRVLDLRFDDLVGDPIGAVDRIYDHFGYAQSDVMKTRMAAWMSDHPRHAAGVHRYDLSQFNLDDDRIDSQFGEYRERYAIQG